MKLNNKIYKSLGLILFLSNINLYPSLATYSNSRYETLEGEYITIEDSREGEVKSIEILGNTLQDSNNLKDIKSVGDLYVDKDGEPILDKQGREQYKINILSHGKNLFNPREAVISYNWRVSTSLTEEGMFKVIPNEGLSSGVAYGEVKVPFKLIKGETYTISAKMTGGAKYIICWDANSHATEVYPVNKPFVAENILDIKIGMYTDLENEGMFEIQIEKSNEKTAVTSYESNNIELLLPAQLEKVGNISDRIINKNGLWGIEKNIEKIMLQKEYLYSIGRETENTTVIQTKLITFSKGSPDNNTIFVLSDKFKSATGNELYALTTDYECICVNKDGTIQIRINKKRGDDPVKAFIDMDAYVYVVSKEPKFVPLSNNQQIKLNTFLNKTYVFSQTENGINPILKVTIDRIINLCEKAIQLAQENPTIDNISTARMWINLLEESALKDNFNNQIDSITQISDLTLEPKKVSSSLDVYVKSDNALSLTVSTNSVIFENFTGVDDMEKLNAINITVNSSLPYQLNSYLLDEITNSDGSNKIEKELFNIKLNGETGYKAFNNINEKLILKDNCLDGNNNQFGIDLIFRGSLSHKADVYKTVIKLEAEQK